MNELERRRRTRTIPTSVVGGVATETHANPRRPNGWTYDPSCSCHWCRLERIRSNAEALVA